MRRSKAVVATVLATLAYLSCSAVSAESYGMQFITPTDGMTVRPGEVIPVKVVVDPGISFDTVLVAVDTEMVPLAPPSYEGTLTIGEEFSGPTTVMAIAFMEGQVQGGGALVEITLNVVPDEPPLSLDVPRGLRVTLPQSEPKEILVLGLYDNDVQRSLNFPGSGVTYASSDPSVATVDETGAVTGVAVGSAYVTVQLGALREYVRIDVRGTTRSILPAIDQTARISISRSGFRVDPETGAVLQTLSVRNISGEPIFTPLVVVITELTDGVFPMDDGSVTQQISPLGTPYALVKGAGREFLLPNDVAEAVLTFLNPNGVAINYTPRVYTAVIP